MENFFFWLLLLDFLSVLVIVKPHSTAFMGSLLSDEEKDRRNGEHGDHPILPRGQLQFFHFRGDVDVKNTTSSLWKAAGTDRIFTLELSNVG